MSNKPKVSICCLAYNHEKFIRQALDGFVMQKTNFPFEVLVHDDASTDKTPEIIREYAKKYPDIIKPIFQKENQFSKGKNICKNYVFPKIQGEYVAMNEGDDYWTDKNKLQKQVDYLDAHPDVSICFHPVRVVWEDKSQPESIFPTPKYRFNKKILSLNDLLRHNFIQTNSVVYRWRLKGKEDLLPDGILPEDYFWHLLHAQVGKIAFLPDVMAVYRRNAGGIWTGAGATDDWFRRCALPHLAFYQAMEKQFNCDKSKEIANMMSKTLMSFLRCKEWNKIQELAHFYPQLYQQTLETHSLVNSSNKYLKKYKKYRKISLYLTVLLCFILMCLILK